MSTNDVSQTIVKLYDEIKGNKHHRFLSWEHCYKAFQDLKDGKIDIEQACLHLAFYLASWGMYRGSSFLLNNDYLIHKPAVQILMQQEYKNFRGISLKNLSGDQENITRLFKLFEDIKASYKDVNRKNAKGNLVNVTDTLVTKILLGALGLCPHMIGILCLLCQQERSSEQY